MTSFRLFSSFALVLALTCQLSAQDGVRWQNDIETAKQIAARSNRLVLIHYWIRDCAPCLKLERNVFSQNDFGRSVEADFVPVKINAQDFPITARRYGVDRFPTDVIITSSGQVVSKSGCPQDAGQYASRLRQVAQSYRRTAEQIASNRVPASNPDRPAYDQPARRPSEDYNRPRRQEADRQLAARPDSGRSPIGTDRRRREELDPRRSFDNPDGDRYEEQRPVDHRQQVAIDRNPRFEDPHDHIADARPRDSQYEPRRDDRREMAPRPSPRQRAYGEQRDRRDQRQPAPAGSDYNRPHTDDRMQNADQSQPPLAPVAAPRPQFGLDGFCPIQLADSFRWVAGDERWGVNHDGHTYLFTSRADRDRFLAHPDRYSPAMAGYDVVEWSKHQTLANGHRQFGVIYRKRVYLFISEQSLETFRQQPDYYVSRVEQSKRARSARQ